MAEGEAKSLTGKKRPREEITEEDEDKICRRPPTLIILHQVLA